MFSKVSIFPVALLALGGTQLASAAGSYDEGQWVTTFMAGSSFIQEGSFNPHVQSGVADLGSIDPALSGIAGVSAIDHLQFKDAFRPGPSFGIETGYMVQSNIEPFARLSYSQMRGRDQEIGFLSAPTLDTATPIRGNFDDMTSWALDFGTRYFLSDTGTMRTYVAGYLGATRTDALDAHFHVVGLTAERGNPAAEDAIRRWRRRRPGLAAFRQRGPQPVRRRAVSRCPERGDRRVRTARYQ